MENNKESNPGPADKTYANSRPEPDRLPKRRRWTLLETEEEKPIENNFEETASNMLESQSKTKSAEFRFKLASYNLLAPHLLNMNYDLYKNINPYYLDWHNRKHKLFYQLQDFDADVCNQFVA